MQILIQISLLFCSRNVPLNVSESLYSRIFYAVKPLSDNLFMQFVILFLLIDTHRFLCFLYVSLNGSQEYLFFSHKKLRLINLPLIIFFFKEACLKIVSKKFSVLNL